jgi:hypothetical protein
LKITGAAGGLIAGQGISAILQAVFKLANIEPNIFTGSCVFEDGVPSCP